jgi:hypothetical protein
MLDVVRRIAVRLSRALDQALEMLKAQQEWIVESGIVHCKALLGGFAGPWKAAGHTVLVVLKRHHLEL